MSTEVELSEYDRDLLESINAKFPRKREWIAALCMQGLLATPEGEDMNPTLHEIAVKAVKAADCLLAELNK